MTQERTAAQIKAHFDKVLPGVWPEPIKLTITMHRKGVEAALREIAKVQDQIKDAAIYVCGNAIAGGSFSLVGAGKGIEISAILPVDRVENFPVSVSNMMLEASQVVVHAQDLLDFIAINEKDTADRKIKNIDFIFSDTALCLSKGGEVKLLNEMPQDKWPESSAFKAHERVSVNVWDFKKMLSYSLFAMQKEGKMPDFSTGLGFEATDGGIYSAVCGSRYGASGINAWCRFPALNDGKVVPQVIPQGALAIIDRLLSKNSDRIHTKEMRIATQAFEKQSKIKAGISGRAEKMRFCIHLAMDKNADGMDGKTSYIITTPLMDIQLPASVASTLRENHVSKVRVHKSTLLNALAVIESGRDVSKRHKIIVAYDDDKAQPNKTVKVWGIDPNAFQVPPDNDPDLQSAFGEFLHDEAMIRAQNLPHGVDWFCVDRATLRKVLMKCDRDTVCFELLGPSDEWEAHKRYVRLYAEGNEEARFAIEPCEITHKEMESVNVTAYHPVKQSV